MVPPPAWPCVDWTELLPRADDADTDGLGFELWNLHRRICDWARTYDVANDSRQGEREPHEYRRCAVSVPRLNHALSVVPKLNATSDRMTVVKGALQISSWAETAGHSLLALRFAEAAAGCDPFDPSSANVAGRLSRTLGMWPRADLWYSGAIGLARARRWSACYVRGHLGLGTLFRDLGMTGRALELYQRAAWRAQRSGIKWLAGEVHHDMLLLALTTRAFPEAETYAARALNVYPKHHDRIPALVHDFGLLCTRERAFTLAYPLLRRLLPLITKPHEKLVVWSTLALSAAGTDEAASYAESRAAVLELVHTFPMSAPPALMNLAFAAQLRREWNAASELANRALEVAAGNPLFGEQTRDAAMLLEQVSRRAPPEQDEPPAQDSDQDTNMRALHDSFARLVSLWHGRTWRARKKQAQPGDFGKV